MCFNRYLTWKPTLQITFYIKLNVQISKNSFHSYFPLPQFVRPHTTEGNYHTYEDFINIIRIYLFNVKLQS